MMDDARAMKDIQDTIVTHHVREFNKNKTIDKNDDFFVCL